MTTVLAGNVSVWCVKHRDGWCAAKPNRRFSDKAINVKTRCNHSVALPGGIMRGKPTCVFCIGALAERSNKS